MRKNVIIFGILIVLIIFSIIQTVQVYNLKKNFNEIKEASNSQNLEAKQVVDNQQSIKVPESLREIPSAVQGCY